MSVPPPGKDPAALALALAGEGLIQFGRFAQPDGSVWPVALHLGWLPSCPALLCDVAAALAPLVAATGADRVLTTAEAIPLGAALAVVADQPVVYPSHDSSKMTAAFAIEGAYDVGHPTALLSDVLLDPMQAEGIRALADRVGLEIHAVVAVMDLGLGARQALEMVGFDVATIFTLRDALPWLGADGWLPARMRTAVEEWLQDRRDGSE